VPLGSEPVAVPGVPGLSALEVAAERERVAFLEAHRASIAALVERGTYLDRSDIDAFLDLSFPGTDEIAALLRLARLVEGEGGNVPHVVVDTAPTGHTLRLLELPRTARGWLRALGAMDAKYRIVAEALAGAAPSDPVTQFLLDFQMDIDRLSSLLRDPLRTRFLLVTTQEPVVMAEAQRYRAALERLQVSLGGVVVNRATAHAADGDAEATFPGLPVAYVPQLAAAPRGPDALRRLAASARAVAPPHAPAPAGAPTPAVRVGDRYRPPPDRRIYLIGGKGGVGKTTLASALGVALAAELPGAVLLLSTDPAGSLGDVFRIPVGNAPVRVPEAERLELRQIDARAAWEAFRAEYHAETAQLFDTLVTNGLSAEADRQVVSGLIDLAPPGVDELMALVGIVDVTEVPTYNALILDTAPTGHLLRLLEMPELGLGWAHTLLRLLLKYRHVVGLGELAERVLAFSRALRILRARLQDSAHTLVMIVALPEALSVLETERLVPRIASLGMAAEVLFINRVLTPQGAVQDAYAADAVRLLRLEGAACRAGAPEWKHGPRGASELLEFANAWRRLSAADEQTTGSR
jgi:arsenite-transporting ATPase